MMGLSIVEAVNTVFGENHKTLVEAGLTYMLADKVAGHVTIHFYGVRDLSNGSTYRANLGSFELSELPGCCAILVSHGVVLTSTLQGKGLGQKLLAMREQIAMLSGYTYLMATTNHRNEVENHILEKHGFKRYEQFQSVRTKNTVNVWMKKVV